MQDSATQKYEKPQYLSQKPLKYWGFNLELSSRFELQINALFKGVKGFSIKKVLKITNFICDGFSFFFCDMRINVLCSANVRMA